MRNHRIAQIERFAALVYPHNWAYVTMFRSPLAMMKTGVDDKNATLRRELENVEQLSESFLRRM